MDSSTYWESMYQKPLSEISWEIEQPPQELVELIESKKIQSPSRVLDLGCGTGNYSVYLARSNFQVTGIDISEEAIRIAQKRAEKEKLPIQFISADLFSMPPTYTHRFDFILDYSVLHHIPIIRTREYARFMFQVLDHGGKMLLVCYSEKDTDGKLTSIGKYGNMMYYRTAHQIHHAYSMFHQLSYKETTIGKENQHLAHCFLFEKR